MGFIELARQELKTGIAGTSATYLSCLVSCFFPSQLCSLFFRQLTACFFFFLFGSTARSFRLSRVVGVVDCRACLFSLSTARKALDQTAAACGRPKHLVKEYNGAFNKNAGVSYIWQFSSHGASTLALILTAGLLNRLLSRIDANLILLRIF